MSLTLHVPHGRTSRRLVARPPALRSALAVVASLYLGIHLCLVAWVAVPALALGWTPRVVATGSMQPSLGAGDVVLADPDADAAVTVGALVVVDRSQDGSIIHRVAEVPAPGRFRTKGDANASFDPGTVARSDVEGVGRLLVPVVGTPAMWVQTGRFAPALVWAATVAGALVLSRPRRRRP